MRLGSGRALCAMFLMLAISGLEPAFATGCVKPPLLFCEDFESATWPDTLWQISGNAPTITTDVVRNGKHAMKTYLNRETSPKSYRTEVSSGGHVEILPGGEYWYGFSVNLPREFVSDNIWEIVAQWHSEPDVAQGEVPGSVNPPVSLHTENGEWKLLTIWDSRVVTSRANYEGKRTYNLGAYKTGEWTDWVFHFIWSPKSDGLLQVWKNGEQVINTKGPIGFNDAVGPYFKMGLYKGWADRVSPIGKVSERTLYQDDVRIAGADGSYDAVAPPGGKPKQQPAAPVGVAAEVQ